jgi:hypothetical protein
MRRKLQVHRSIHPGNNPFFRAMVFPSDTSFSFPFWPAFIIQSSGQISLFPITPWLRNTLPQMVQSSASFDPRNNSMAKKWGAIAAPQTPVLAPSSLVVPVCVLRIITVFAGIHITLGWYTLQAQIFHVLSALDALLKDLPLWLIRCHVFGALQHIACRAQVAHPIHAPVCCDCRNGHHQ